MRRWNSNRNEEKKTEPRNAEMLVALTKVVEALGGLTSAERTRVLHTARVMTGTEE